MKYRTLIGSTLLTLGMFVAGAVTPGCQSAGGNTVSNAANAIKGLVGDWDLSKLGGVDIGSLLPQGAKAPSLGFTNEGKISGFTGVNRLASSLDLNKLAKGEFAMAPAAATKMAGPPESMNVENQFLTALGKVTGYKVDGNNLSLSDKTGELLKFVKH